MDAIAQLLSSLKESEKSIVITIIANALIIYLICFVGLEQFKTYQWYQQIIIPCSLSICYTITFYFLIITLLGVFYIFKGCRDFCSFMMGDNYKWFVCVFSLANFSTLTEVMSTLMDKSHELSFTKILSGAGFVFLGLTILMILMAIFNNKKYSPE